MSLLTLNELANAYARGKLDKENYRQSRSALLKGIVEGKVPVESAEYLSPLEVAEDAVTKPQEDWDTTQIAGGSGNAAPAKPKTSATGNITAEDMAKPVKESRSTLPVRYIVISSCIVLLLIIAIILFYPKPPGSTAANQPTSAPANKVLISAEKSKVGENLIASFIQKNKWDEASLNTFLSDWNELSPQEKLAATQTKRMQRLSSTIYKKFLEEKALIGIDKDKAISRQQKLIDFAQALGIYDARMEIK